MMRDRGMLLGAASLAGVVFTRKASPSPNDEEMKVETVNTPKPPPSFGARQQRRAAERAAKKQVNQLQKRVNRP